MFSYYFEKRGDKPKSVLSNMNGWSSFVFWMLNIMCFAFEVILVLIIASLTTFCIETIEVYADAPILKDLEIMFISVFTAE